MPPLESEPQSHANATLTTASLTATFPHHFSRSSLPPNASNIPTRAKLGTRTHKKSKGISGFQVGEFMRFPKLPAELRLMVWDLSLGPRIVEMRFINNCMSTQFDFIADIPAILQVNREVRSEYKKRYKVLFANQNCQAPAYFNSGIDVLHIRSAVRRSAASRSQGRPVNILQIISTINTLPNKDEVRHLSTSPSFFPASWYTHAIPPIFAFKNLETVTVSFVRNRYECHHNSDIWKTGHTRSHISPVQPREDEKARACQESVQSFKNEWKDGKWGRADWKMPDFTYKALCLDMVHPSKMFCPPRGLGRVKRKRDAEEETNWSCPPWYSDDVKQRITKDIIKDREMRRKKEKRDVKKEAARDMSWLPGYIKDVQATDWKAHRIILAGPRKSVGRKISCWIGRIRC